MKQNLITGPTNEILEHLDQAEYEAHYILIYPDIQTLREIYSRYVKGQLEDNNEMVLILPYYETVDKIRKILSEGFIDDVAAASGRGSNSNSNSNSIIDVRKYEKEGSLVIMDSVKAYFGSDNNHYDVNDTLLTFVKQLVRRKESFGKNGVSVISDLGSFYNNNHHSEIDKLVEYELSLPSRYEGMKFKGFCVYHEADFDKRFTEEQRQKLLKHHGKKLKVAINY